MPGLALEWDGEILGSVDSRGEGLLFEKGLGKEEQDQGGLTPGKTHSGL